MYQCSYCKSGTMNTKEQYLTHINGTKHKKKAFQLQAPFGGIEYEEFRPVSRTIAAEPFISRSNDFPSLSDNASTSAPLTNGSYRDHYDTINNGFEEPRLTNGFCNGQRFEDEISDRDSPKAPKTIDDVFFKPDSRCSAARYTIDSYSKNIKTASAALNEISVLMYWKLDFDQVPAQNKKYGFMVRIDGVNLIQGEGDNKKEAKQHASAEAIKFIRLKLKKEKSQNDNHSNTINQVTRTHRFNQMEHPADAYCRLTIDKLLEIENLRANKFVVPRRYAAFIITDKEDQLAKDGVVVAFGAGDGVLKDTENLRKYPGYHVTNFDSVVLAKRSLQCFFFNQLNLLFDKNPSKNKTEKVYLTVAKNGKVRLRDGTRLHLFMSHAPYGDCVESLPYNWIDPKEMTAKEMERDKNGRMEPTMFMTYNNTQFVKQPGHIRILREDRPDQWISLLEYRSKKKVAPDSMTMSPTDKVTCWVHVGVQGALLSHLMEPVHLYSIQVAHNYMHEHFSRAILCRVPLENLGLGKALDRWKDPYIGRVSSLTDVIRPFYELQSSNVSYNWYSNPVTELPEIIDNETGLVHQDSPFKLPDGDSEYACSRLSKVCMLMRLKTLFKVAINYYALRPELQRTRNLQGIGDAAGHRYNLFKNSAIDYRSLKQSLFQQLQEKRYGEWAPNNSANNFDLLQYYDL